MIPVVNMKSKMTSKMRKALCRFETVCAVTQKATVSDKEVRDWLAQNFDDELAKEFDSGYFFSTQDSSAGPR
jgi:hypothetical protein